VSRHEQLFGSVIMILDRNVWATMLRSGACCTRVSFE